MKRWTLALCSVFCALSLAACGADDAAGSEAPSVSSSPEVSSSAPSSSSAPEEAGSAPEASSFEAAAPEEEGSRVLVAYFTYGENAALPEGVDVSASASIQLQNGEITGNTGLVASMIAEATGADLFSIRTAEAYPATYDETIDQGLEEQNANARPALAAQLENPEQYDVVFLGYPNWWGDLPMAVYSFLEETDLSGKTIVPFVTSGGSGFSDTVSAIESLEPDAAVLQGLALSASGAAGAQDEVNQWLSGLAIG